MKLFEDMPELEEKIKKIKPYLWYVDTALRAFLTALLHCVMVGLTTSAARIDPLGNYEVVPYYAWARWAVECVIVYFTLNTVILSFAIYNKRDREDFLSRNGSTFDLGEEAALLKKRKDVKLYILLSCVFFALLPTPVGYEGLLFPISSFISVPPILQRIAGVLVYAILTLLLTQKRMLEVRSYWLETPRKLMNSGQKWKALEIKIKQHYSYWRFGIKYAVNVLMYIVGAIMAVMLIGALYTFIGILIMLAFEWWAWAILGAVLFLFYSKAIRKRHKLLKKIHTLCREYGFELFDCKHPYLSIFFHLKRYTFAIAANGKTYYCRLIAGVNRLNKMYFDEDGYCTRTLTLSIPTPRVVSRGGFAQMLLREDSEDLEIIRLRFRSKYTFEIDGKGERMILLNPVPRRVFFKQVGIPRQEMDNGDRVGDYTVYSGNSFLRYLERSTGKAGE